MHHNYKEKLINDNTNIIKENKLQHLKDHKFKQSVRFSGEATTEMWTAVSFRPFTDSIHPFTQHTFRHRHTTTDVMTDST